MTIMKRCLCALLVWILTAGMLCVGLTGCAISGNPGPEETEPTATIPLAERIIDDLENGVKISQDTVAKSISMSQLSTTEEAPSFTFYKDGAPLSGKQWAVTGKIRVETESGKEGQLQFIADKDSDNQANIIVSRCSDGINGIYQNRLVSNVRTPEEDSYLVSNTLVDSTDWSAEFAFIFYMQTVSLYLREPGEDFLLMASMNLDWDACTAKFSLIQNANVMLSEVDMTTNNAKIKTMCTDLEAPPENPIESIRVLFIGNSGTAYKDADVPKLLSRLARNAGYYVDASAIVLGNGTFAQHADTTTDHGKMVAAEIAKGYDIVFLQEISSCICSEANREKTLEASKTLDAAIRAANSETYFYVRPPMRKDTYAGQDNLQQCVEYDRLFTSVAKEIGATNIYVNRAFAYVIQNSYINLWIEDNVHSNAEGEYLIACVFFASLFNQSATTLGYNGLDEEVAKTLQEAADKVVFENYMPTYTN